MPLELRTNPTHRYLPPLLSAVLLLSGCQSLQPVSLEQPPPQTAPATDSVATHQFPLPADQNLIGDLASLQSRRHDTLSDIARHYGLGYTEISLANPQLDAWNLQDGDTVLLPLSFIVPEAPRKGIVLNLANMRLFHYPLKHHNRVETYPVGIGRDGWNTPVGLTEIISKRKDPVWSVPESIQREHEALGDPLPKVVKAGPDNPLGAYALPLGINGYLIHGTNKPYGIGMQVSHGCVQLYPEDIEALFEQVKIGTPVRIVHQPYLIAWKDGALYLEAHPPLEKWAKSTAKLQQEAKDKLRGQALVYQTPVDWDKVEQVLQRSDGVPTPVTLGSPDAAALLANATRLNHPERFFAQPEINDIGDNDWALKASGFETETEAQKFAAMLNHQGPPIPARKVFTDGSYQVLAGPFKSKQAAKRASKRIKENFDIQASTVSPKPTLNN